MARAACVNWPSRICRRHITWLASWILPFEAPFFNEFVARTNGTTPEHINAKLAGGKDHRRIAAGAVLPGTERLMLLCATEMNKRAGHGRRGCRIRRPLRTPMIKKVSKHIVQNEPLLFELSSPGKIGYQLPALDVPEVDAGRSSRRSRPDGDRRISGSERT